MLNLLPKTIEELRAVMEAMRLDYEGDYKTLRLVSIPLPRGDKINPGQLTMLAESCAIAREYSDTASRLVGRWYQFWKEFEILLKHKKNKLLSLEWEDRVTRKAELAGGSKEDRHIILQSFHKQEWSDFLEIEAFSEELNAYYTVMRSKYASIRASQEDINTYTALIRTSMFDRQFNPTAPDNQHRSVENLNKERSAAYDMLHNRQGPDPMGHRTELLSGLSAPRESDDIPEDTITGTVTL